MGFFGQFLMQTTFFPHVALVIAVTPDVHDIQTV